jgi:hypothetical protein
MRMLSLRHLRKNLIQPTTVSPPILWALVIVGTCCLHESVSAADKDKVENTSTADAKRAASPKPDKDGWTPLFNEKNLDGWKSTNFGGEGEVYLEKGNVVITQGVDLSGINSSRKDLPLCNYEIEFEAQRAAGSDFFVGLTFPVRKSSCSLILGGWGGGVCGLSSLDGMDASENETTSYMAFTNGQWYKIRLKVTDDTIEAWLDKQQLVEVETEDRKIDVRFEVEISKPLGFATYQSTAWIRKARIRQLPKAKSPQETTNE